MKPYYLLVTFCLGCVSGRGGLDYRISHTEYNNQDCQQEKEACFVANINYPEFEGLDSLKLIFPKRIVGNSIIDALGMGDSESTELPDIEKALNYVAGSLEKAKDSFTYGSGWIVDVQTIPVYKNDTILVFALEIMTYFGGVHPNTNRVYYNLNRQTGKRLHYNWFSDQGFEEKAEAIFRRINHLNPDDIINDLRVGYSFPNNKFQLPANYGFKGDSVVLYYNRYEIAPYAKGPTEYVIPIN